MPLQIHQFACLSDNYGFLAHDLASGQTACIDTPDADAVLAALKAKAWTLDLILNTHWHPDHAGGNAKIKAATGATVIGPQEVEKISPLDRIVVGGDRVALGETEFAVMDTGGHTLGHVSYYSAKDQTVFVGDTLFALGCGRLFEGTPDQMWASLSQIANLPDETVVYCAHEYTASNARFALSLDGSPELARRAEAIFAARARGEATVPTQIGLEKATNPFLRPQALAGALELLGQSDVSVFAALRAAKDGFKP